MSKEEENDIYAINDQLQNIRGRIAVDTGRELGTAVYAHCNITMLIPRRLLIREQLRQLLGTSVPANTNRPANATLLGEDNVTLQCGQSGVEVDRERLMAISPKTRQMFGVTCGAKVTVYDVGVSQEAVKTVIHAACNRCESVSMNAAAPFFVYEVMALSTIFDYEPLRVWSQLTFLERLCAPGLILEQIPICDAVEGMWTHGDMATPGTKIVLTGLVLVLSDMQAGRVRPRLNQIIHRISQAPLLSRILQPVVLVSPVVQGSCVQIFILADRTMTLNVELSFSVARVKAMIAEKGGVPAGLQRLVYGAKPLQDDRSLFDYGIQRESTVIANLRVCESRADIQEIRDKDPSVTSRDCLH